MADRGKDCAQSCADVPLRGWHVADGGFGHNNEEEHLVGMLKVMSKRGDDRHAWDTRRLAVGDPEAEAAVREAERIFNDERARGATAYKIAGDKTTTRIDQFDRTAEQIVVIPRVVGG